MHNFKRLIRGRKAQTKVLIITMSTSYVMLIGGILLQSPLWVIALAMLTPWVPLFTGRVIWSSKHYGFMAIYLVFMVAQAGHVGEHVAQVAQFIFYTGPEHSKCLGWSWNGPGCMDASGIFGALDRELVHFLWESLTLIASILLWMKFPRNPWMKWQFLGAFIHSLEHFFLYPISLIPGTGYPNRGMFMGINVKKLDAGLFGHDGVVGSLTGLDGFINALLPNRINLHFLYNLIVFILMILAFSYQLRHLYDGWLAKAFKFLSQEELAKLTRKGQLRSYKPGEVIITQGEAADSLYLITEGQVEVLCQDEGKQEVRISVLGRGVYFGEIGLLTGSPRSATVRAMPGGVETLRLEREAFEQFLKVNTQGSQELEQLSVHRLKELAQVQKVASAS